MARILEVVEILLLAQSVVLDKLINTQFRRKDRYSVFRTRYGYDTLVNKINFYLLCEYF